MTQLELYKREVIALEKQAEALDRIASALHINALDRKFGNNNIAEAGGE